MTQTLRHSWREVRARILALILDGTYRPGDKLPRDKDIAERLGCARSTVQRAMGDLSDAGIVERRRKGGTHVRPDPVTRATFDIPIARKEVEQQGSTYGYNLLDLRTENPPPAIAEKFGLPKTGAMLHVEALHLADERPYILEDRWICVETVPEIMDVDLAVHSANEWLVQHKPYSRCDLRFYAIEADAKTADRLAAPVGSALFVMDRTTWIEDAPITTVQAATAPGYQLLTRT